MTYTRKQINEAYDRAERMTECEPTPDNMARHAFYFAAAQAMETAYKASKKKAVK